MPKPFRPAAKTRRGARHARAAAPARPQRRSAPRRPLHGRVALVTGGAARIGAAIARALAAAGADVVVHHHRSAGAAQDLANELRRHGVRAATVAGDLANPKDRAGLLAAAGKASGRPIDLLVNNASTYPERRLGDLTWTNLQGDLALNAWAPLELSLAFAQQVPKEGGSIVNLLDARIVDDDRRHAGYWLAKRMLADMTRLAALELAPRVTVNGVAPGPALAPPGTPEAKAQALLAGLRARLPLRRTPTPDDVALAVVHLASSPAVTGQVLFVDGGRHLGRPEA